MVNSLVPSLVDYAKISEFLELERKTFIKINNLSEEDEFIRNVETSKKILSFLETIQSKLKKILENQLQKKHAFYKDVGDLKNLNPDKVIIQADKELPFKLVKNMLHTIVVAGYFNYQFVVVPENKK